MLHAELHWDVLPHIPPINIQESIIS
jgi:hypothetical protein